MLSLDEIKEALDPVLLFDRDGFDIQQLFVKELKDCAQNNIPYFILPDATRNHASQESKKKSGLFIKIISRLAQYSLFKFFNEVRKEVAFYRRKIANLKDFIDREKIDTLVTAEENILMDTFLYKMAAGNKKVFVSPYTIPNPKEMATGSYCNFPTFSVKGILMSIFWGRFSRSIDGKVYLILKPSKIFSFFCVGYLPKNPWVLNDDNADLVLLESQQMATIYSRLGVSESHIKVIGSLNDDRLLKIKLNKELLKQAFQKKYNLAADRPILLVSFPPNQFPCLTAEHKNYEELISSFQDALEPYKNKYTIVITKHPRVKHSLEPLTKSGLIVVEDPTIDLIPFSYVYLAAASATIRWAIASGIPVVNYDPFGYRYGDYNDAMAVTTVYSSVDLKKHLKQILEDDSYYLNSSTQQLKDSTNWGIQDGHVVKRFVEIIVRASQNEVSA